MSNKRIYVPMITPANSKGDVCSRSTENFMSTLFNAVDGFVPCLTSGEGWKLSDKSWKTMFKTCIEVAGKDRVMVGIERPSTDQVLELVDYANVHQPHAIVVTTPFGESVHQDQMIRHFEKIAVGSDSDIIIYNESALSKNVMGLSALLEVSKLNNVTGIKDSPDTARHESEISYLREMGVKYLIGWEEDLHTGRANDGNIVSMSNLTPGLCVEENQKENKIMQKAVKDTVEELSLSKHDWYRHIKECLYQRGVITSPALVK